MKLQTLVTNKVVVYLSSRYLTYFLQFITSLVIAAKLGPYYFGIWGFVLLLLSYFQQCHFGIYNSMNVLYVQHKTNSVQCNNYIVNAWVLEIYLAIFVMLLYLAYSLFGFGGFEKYHADRFFFWICIIAILQYFSTLIVNVFRVKNHLGYVAFCQSIIVILNFVSVFFFTGETLIYFLIAGHLLGNLSAIILALISGVLQFRGATVSFSYQKELISKGLLLFLYNACFYFIIISIRTIISSNYSVEEFGLFTFSFSLAHAVLLLLESISFVIFPKIIGKLSSDQSQEITDTLRVYRTTYITSAHALIYLALLAFPLLLFFFPKYNGALTSMNLIALTVLMNSSGSGYSELLIAKNKEKTLSVISASSLAINCVSALFLVKVIHCGFSYVILASLFTYLFFSFLLVRIGCKTLGVSQHEVWSIFFPLRLLIPYVCALVISCLAVEYLLLIPFMLFVLLNIKQLKYIYMVVKRLLVSPQMVNL